jgi:hypothetical protein
MKKLKMYNIVIENQGLEMGLEATSKQQAIEKVILMYKDLHDIDLKESDILEIYQVIPRKYKGE